jgi:hypothetical protein
MTFVFSGKSPNLTLIHMSKIASALKTRDEAMKDRIYRKNQL